MSAEIQKLYIAYFNRPADPGGLAYWTDQLAKGATMTTIANSFSASAEYQAIYAGKSNLVLIDQLYQNLFGRTADVGGLLFWSNEMLAGRVTITTVASALSSGTTAGSADNIAINSKIAAASAFTAAIDTAPELLAYSGTAATAQASAWLSTVTTAATLATAITPATLAAAVASSVASSTVSTGSTFTLTTGIDNFTGTANNDIFNANADAASASNNISGSDILNGGAGTTDNLSIRVTDMTTGGTASVAPSMTAIELLTIDSDESVAKEYFTLSAAGATGITNIISSGSVAGSQIAVTNVVASAAVGMTNTKGQMAVDFASTVFASTSATDTIAVNLVGAGDTASGGTAATLWLDGGYSAGGTAVGTSDNTLEILTITSNTTASRVDMLGGSAVKTLNISGNANLTLTDTNNSFAAVTTVNASTLTGALDINVAASTANITITTNTGDDRVNAGAVSTNLTDLDTLTLGTGTDTVAVSNSSFDAAALTIIKAKLTSAEVLELNGTLASASYSFADIGIISSLNFTGTNTGTAGASGADAGGDGTNGGVTVTMTGLESGDSITFSASTTGGAGGTASTAASAGQGGAALSITPNIDGGSDSITITLTGGVSITGGAGGGVIVAGSTGATSGLGGNGISASSVETINIVSSGTSANTIAGGAAGATGGSGVAAALAAGSSILVNTNGTINVTGARDINIGTIAGTNASVNASSFTGKLTVTGEAGNNTITGGSAVDTIDGAAGIDTITGGGGADIINFKLGTGTTDSQSNFINLGATANSTADSGTGLSVDSITDYTKGTDLISITSSAAAAVTLAAANVTANATASAGVSAISSGGKATFVAADDTLMEMAIATAMGIKANTSTAGDLAYFELSGSSYLFVSDATDGLTDGDLLVKLTGVTGLTAVAFSSGDVILS